MMRKAWDIFLFEVQIQINPMIFLVNPQQLNHFYFHGDTLEGLGTAISGGNGGPWKEG